MRSVPWLVAACVLMLALDVGCGQGIVGRVRERDGSIARRRLDLWELVAARRAQVDLPCDFDRLVVGRVWGTQRIVAEGCGRAVTYACVEGPRAPLCNLETVGAEVAPRAASAPFVLGPPQS